MASSDSESDWEKQSSNHGDNPARIFRGDNQEENEVEDASGGKYFPIDLSRTLVMGKKDSEEEPTIPQGIDRLHLWSQTTPYST